MLNVESWAISLSLLHEIENLKSKTQEPPTKTQNQIRILWKNLKED
jgi:hypothetical protein